MRMKCLNPACVFVYQSMFDGPKKARPVWAVPLREVSA